MPTNRRRTLVSRWRFVDGVQFRDAGRAISDSLVAIGLTRTTAPINWDIIAAPTTANTLATGADEEFAFAGALQSTYPIRLRVRYGTGGGTALFQLTLTWIVGSVTIGTTTYAGTTAGSNLDAGTSYLASDGENWLALVFGVDTWAQSIGTWTIERYRDAAGNYDGAGAYLLAGGLASYAGHWNLTPGQSGTYTGVQGRGVPCFLGAISSGGPLSSVSRSQVALYPHNIPHAGQAPTVLMSGFVNDYTKGERITLPDGRAYLGLDPAVLSHPYMDSTGATLSNGYARLMVRNDGAAV